MSEAKNQMRDVLQELYTCGCSVIDALDDSDLIDADSVERFEDALHEAKAALSHPAPDVPEQHSDDVAVDRFAAALKAKLAKKRRDGRGGWDDPEQCSAAFLSKLMREHVEKGDPLDVGAFAMMLQQRGEPIQPAPEPTFPDIEPWQVTFGPGRKAPGAEEVELRAQIAHHQSILAQEERSINDLVGMAIMVGPIYDQLLRLLDAAREELQAAKMAARPFLVWAGIDDGRPDDQDVESLIPARDYRRLAAALNEPKP
jgi:hypothetical protein